MRIKKINYNYSSAMVELNLCMLNFLPCPAAKKARITREEL